MSTEEQIGVCQHRWMWAFGSANRYVCFDCRVEQCFDVSPLPTDVQEQHAALMAIATTNKAKRAP